MFSVLAHDIFPAGIRVLSQPVLLHQGSFGKAALSRGLAHLCRCSFDADYYHRRHHHHPHHHHHYHHHPEAAEEVEVVEDVVAASEQEQETLVNVAPPLQNGHMVVDGVELHMGCTLATLGAACGVLGIGKSGGKTTILQRIETHLKKQDLLLQHEFQTDARDFANLPREQTIPRSLLQRRKGGMC